jgi:hypothetical protein
LPGGVTAISFDAATGSRPRRASRKSNAVAHALRQSGSVMRIKTNRGNRMLIFSLGLHDSSK